MTSYTFRPRSNINWKELCYGESLPCLKKERTKEAVNRVVLPESYTIERLIAKKSDKNEGDLFLVKWCNYDDTETTWEPKAHIDEVSLFNYIPKEVNSQRLQSAAQNLEEAIFNRLKRGHRSCNLQIRFDLDIFRYCFQDDKEIMVNSVVDFSKLPLSANWHYRIDQNAVGQRVRFPVRLTPKLRFRKTVFFVNGEAILKLKPLEVLQMSVPTCNF